MGGAAPSWPFSLKENGTAMLCPLHVNRRNALGRSQPGAGVCMFEDIREDWQAHDCNWARHGFWALVVYRFGRWRYGIQWRPLRAPLSFVYKVMKFWADSLLGIEIPCETVIGRRLTTENTGAIVFSAGAGCG